MPEDSPAPSEHSLIQEISAPLATLPDDPVPVVADVEFPVVLRGYDRIAVDAYVRKTSQLVAELTATRSPDAAVRRALERVGEEVSGILKRAHETAAEITAKSRSDAEDRLEVARQEAARITAAADEQVRHLDAETDRIWAERHRIVEDAQELARQLLALAESAAERFPAEEPPAPAAGPPPPAAGPLPPLPPPGEPARPPFGVAPPELADEVPAPIEELPWAQDEPLPFDEPPTEATRAFEVQELEFDEEPPGELDERGAGETGAAESDPDEPPRGG